MQFDLDQRTASLSVGEFADFTLGPHESGSGPQGIWRAQLGTYWHNELRTQAAAENPAATFEVVIAGRVVHRGWTLTLTGRIDQILPTLPATVCNPIGDKLSEAPAGKLVTLREIKTVTRALPADEAELRADYPGYFAQVATYLALSRIADPAAKLRAELHFLEAGSGLAQTIALTPADETIHRVQLERVVEFLELRHRARERLRHLAFRPAFSTLRPGQETTQAQLAATFAQTPAVLFEAPTGFGKTGVLLEFALGQLRSGHFERVLYLTSKSTGQLQVMRTLSAMTTPGSELSTLNPQLSTPSPATSVAAWHVRNKQEHCVNTTFHCVRDSCRFLDGIESRWAQSGLARFYLVENHARDLDTLRTAGRAAQICPYEITRAALAFNDVWLGDYNYVFAPANRGLFYLQPGFDPARTLIIVDEAHNLPSRVADAHSHLATATDAHALLAELDHIGAAAPLLRAVEEWTRLLASLLPIDSLDPATESEVCDILQRLATHCANTPLDYAALGPVHSDLLWRFPALHEWLIATDLASESKIENQKLVRPRLGEGGSKITGLLWCPRAGELAFTCIDAAPAIGETLRAYGGVILASATLSPTAEFVENIGLTDFGLRKPDTGNVTESEGRARPPGAPRTTSDSASAPGGPSGSALPSTTQSDLSGIRFPQSEIASLTAVTPWRDGAYDIAIDTRVDTTFQQRSRHFATTAQTIIALHAAASSPSAISHLPSPNTTTPCVVVFFPSYAYAESIQRTLADTGNLLRVALQPRLHDLAAQTAWVEESLAFTDALFLVLGSSFAESIDLLGGRISHAMVVGPALPEVNAVQRARLAEFSPLGREAAARRVYQIPGMQKVNQALGRLVRAPGQRAKVLLHCRRFAELSYSALLARDYQLYREIGDAETLTDWLSA